MNHSRTIVVTGSSRGIGAVIRDRLVNEGHQVIGVSRKPGPRAERYEPVSIDLSRLDDLTESLRGAVAPYAIDGLVANAGGPAFGHLEQLSARDIRRFVDLNLTSHLLVTQAVLPLLKSHPLSNLVFIGSESALRGGKRGSIYCAAKFGLRGFAQSLRQECSTSGVRVTLIHPGMVRTGFFDDLDFEPGEAPDNVVQPSDIADAVCLALSARAGTVFDEIQVTPLKRVVRSRERPTTNRS